MKRQRGPQIDELMLMLMLMLVIVIVIVIESEISGRAGIHARRLLRSFLLSHHQHHCQDGDRDRQYHIQPQRAGKCRHELFVKRLTDLFDLARDQAAVDLADSFGRTRLLQKLLLRK